jgi:hypothetical protein
MVWSLFVKLRYKSGRRSFTTHLEQVQFAVLSNFVSSVLTPCLVREILPEIVSQIVYLVAGDEPEQQEVCLRPKSSMGVDLPQTSLDRWKDSG